MNKHFLHFFLHKSFFWFLFLSILSNIHNLSAQYNLQNLALMNEDKLTHFRYKNLQLFPIIANETFLEKHKNIGNYTVLQEALIRKQVKITEQSYHDKQLEHSEYASISTTLQAESSNDIAEKKLQQNNNTTLSIYDNNVFHQQILEQVEQKSIIDIDLINELLITNISEDTLYLMAGEVIRGGKQDRVVAKDMLVLPKSEKVALPVFCVEKGRWNYKKDAMQPFNEYFHVSSMQIRQAIQQSDNQELIWKVIEKINRKNEVVSKTQAYTELAQSGVFRTQFMDYFGFFKDVFKEQKNVIGLVVVSGNEILGCDLFATPHLFEQKYNSLLYSYCTEAITSGDVPNVERKKVMAYLTEFLGDEQSQELIVKDKGSVFEHQEQKLHITTF